MGYSDQKFYDRPQLITNMGPFLTTTLTASGTNTLTPFIPNSFIRAKVINSIWSVCQTAPAANTTNALLYFKNGTNTYGTLTLCGTAVATAGQTAKATITAPVVSTNTFTNTLPNGSTVVTSNTTTAYYNQFTSGSAPTVTLIAVGTASGQSVGNFEIENEEQELYS